MTTQFNLKDENLINQIKSQLKDEDIACIAEYRIVEVYPDMRFVIRNGFNILQQKVLLVGRFENASMCRSGFYRNSIREDVWVDVPVFKE